MQNIESVKCVGTRSPETLDSWKNLVSDTFLAPIHLIFIKFFVLFECKLLENMQRMSLEVFYDTKNIPL